MPGVSTETLEKEIAEILKNANLATTSTKKVRQQLEKKLGVDLAEERKKIDQLVMKYVNSKEDDEAEEEEEEEEEASEEEEKKKPAKRPPTKAAKKRKPSSEEEEDASEGSDSEEEKKPSPKKKVRGKKKGDSDSDWGKDKAAKGKKGGGRGKGGGYTRAYKLSPQLAELMGEAEMPRHEVVKRVWAIIKEKQLYDPNNKQFAICDAALLKVFGTTRFRTFGMMKYLKNHFLVD